ncbi:MAG: hypothetical protein Q4F80_03395 [bacterium]|nr:hypothetical protein [bacterium]
MDIVNYNQYAQNIGMQSAKETPVKEQNLNCFDENDWTGNAANAIGEAFNNMDDFIALFQEQTKPNGI